MNSKHTPQIHLKLSTRAMNLIARQSIIFQYNGHSTTTGPLHYIKALLTANSGSPAEYWKDTRPITLRLMDGPRINYTYRNQPTPRLPIWHNIFELDADPRKPRAFNKAQAHALLTIPTPSSAPVKLITDHFLITTQRSNSNPLAAFLEAYGQGYLSPRYPPTANPKPLNPKERFRYINKRKFELMF